MSGLQQDKPDLLVVKQNTFVVPDISIKEVRDSIPPHCFNRSTLISSLYLFRDGFGLVLTYKITSIVDSFMKSTLVSVSHPFIYSLARTLLWSLYGLGAGLFAGALFAVGHDCGHQAFSESKFLCDCVGLVIHTLLGVPYFSWRISHAQHHAFTGHMSKDHTHIPRTRSGLGLRPLDPLHENAIGSHVSQTPRAAIWESISETPAATTVRSIAYAVGFNIIKKVLSNANVQKQLFGWPLYLLTNFQGPVHYPKGTNPFNPHAVIFRPRHFWLVVWSDVALGLWIAVLVAWGLRRGTWEVITVYGVPYLWLNHFIVFGSLLQHSDPRIPRYRDSEFTFVRGALTTLDRPILGCNGSFIAWFSGLFSHGFMENHVVHHLCSKIPHYNTWEASISLRKFLLSRGIQSEGAPATWSEVIPKSAGINNPGGNPLSEMQATRNSPNQTIVPFNMSGLQKQLEKQKKVEGKIGWPLCAKDLLLVDCEDSYCTKPKRSLKIRYSIFILDVPEFLEEHSGGPVIISEGSQNARSIFHGGVYDHPNAVYNVIAHILQ
ncbi:hypothetical protein NP233_g1776 [Leucocoprinus birnbaumii]|uniref:Fatty acid desaturase domain-containing protein n=1 Tax=Leucocoprinus birnbaumii TaxID=56174 RepID=A0AAD5YZF6_9AGAR|nr:hypothetical protein NP233_g1776 [Leucocoprinus birnbaumii]